NPKRAEDESAAKQIAALRTMVPARRTDADSAGDPSDSGGSIGRTGSSPTKSRLGQVPSPIKSGVCTAAAVTGNATSDGPVSSVASHACRAVANSAGTA